MINRKLFDLKEIQKSSNQLASYNQPHVPSKIFLKINIVFIAFCTYSHIKGQTFIRDGEKMQKKSLHYFVCKFFLFSHSSLHFRILIDAESSKSSSRGNSFKIEKKNFPPSEERTLEYYELEINANVICEVLRIFKNGIIFKINPSLSIPRCFCHAHFVLNCCVAFPIRNRSLISMPQPDGFNLKFISYEFFSFF